MSQFQGVRSQFVNDELYFADGTITAGGTSQLILPRHRARSYLLIQNKSNAQMWFEFGGARATVAISGGALTTFTITNGGFGYIRPPKVLILGAGPVDGDAGANVGAGSATWPAPSNIGTAVPTVAGGIITGIVASNPGSGYTRVPKVVLESANVDAIGCADPFFGSVPSGILLNSGAPPLVFAGICPTGPVAVYCPDTSAAFACRYMY